MLTEVTVFTIWLLLETTVLSSGGHEQEIEIYGDPHWLQCSDLLVIFKIWWLISGSGDANYHWQPDLDFTLWAAIVAFLLKVAYLNIQDTQRNICWCSYIIITMFAWVMLSSAMAAIKHGSSFQVVKLQPTREFLKTWFLSEVENWFYRKTSGPIEVHGVVWLQTCFCWVYGLCKY